MKTTEQFTRRILPPTLAAVAALALMACSEEGTPSGGTAPGRNTANTRNAGTTTDAAAPAPRAAGQKPLVVASNYPLSTFAERIGGDRVEVVFPAPEDGDPAFWDPQPADIATMQKADVLLFNGATYEKWADRVTLPEDRIVNTSESFKNLYVEEGEAVVHSHGPGESHSHGAISFTTWLDPQLAAQQAEAIANALAETDPEGAEAFQANLNELKAELETLDETLEGVTKGHQQTPLLASHPVYGYFARRYDLNLQSRHWEPDTMPEEKDWVDLDNLLESHPAKIMLWEDQPLPEIAQKLSERGIQSVVFYPLGNRPPAETPEYIQTMYENANRLREALGGGESAQ